VQAISSTVATLDGYAQSEYTLKLDTNGWVTGFGLINGGNGNDEFTINASRFVVKYPGESAMSPFTIDQVNGQTVIAINGTVIGDNNINTQALALNSVTVPEGRNSNGGFSGGSMQTLSGTSMTMNWGSTPPGFVLISGCQTFLNTSGSEVTATLAVQVGGLTTGHVSCTIPANHQQTLSLVWAYGASGTGQTISLRAQSTPTACTLFNRAIYAIGGKR